VLPRITHIFACTCNIWNFKSSVLSIYGISKNVELSYNMTLMHIKSNLYLFLYPHKANIKDLGTKLVEHTQYSNVFFFLNIVLNNVRNRIWRCSLDKSGLLPTR
jgi:hypothetical protein